MQETLQNQNLTSNKNPYFDAPNKVDIWDKRQDLLLEKRIICKCVGCSVDLVIWNEEGQNVTENSNGQSQISCK